MLASHHRDHSARERWFRIAVTLKGLDGIIEAAAGIGLLVAGPERILHLATVLTWHWLVAHPRAFFSNLLFNSAEHLSAATERFAAIYLLGHGIVKIGLVAALLNNRGWAYPSAIVVFAAFVIYMLYRFTETHSLALVALALFDLVVITLIWLEYRAARRRRRS
jgi:uncharacterized membrane protein